MSNTVAGSRQCDNLTECIAENASGGAMRMNKPLSKTLRFNYVAHHHNSGFLYSMNFLVSTTHCQNFEAQFRNPHMMHIS